MAVIDFNKTKKVKTPTETTAVQPVTALATLDANKACAQFSHFIDGINEVKKTASALVITDQESIKEATVIATTAKKLGKEIDAHKKEITDPASVFVKSVSNFCKNFTEPLKEIESDLRVKVSQYQAQRELERRKQEEDARKAREKLQKEINAKAKKEGVEAPQVPELVQPKADTVTRTDEAGSSYQKKIWLFEIVDAEKIPREYLAPDEKSIREAVRMGQRTIPGVRIFEEMTTVFKTK